MSSSILQWTWKIRILNSNHQQRLGPEMDILCKCSSNEVGKKVMVNHIFKAKDYYHHSFQAIAKPKPYHHRPVQVLTGPRSGHHCPLQALAGPRGLLTRTYKGNFFGAN
ncbi:hypothetical protein SLE2022_099760 [Rubroshorea leprosula]